MHIFSFKHFSLTDTGCGMKIGTDAVLLGAWTNVPVNGKILDIGTGCGILALMLAQKNPLNKIYAIDIDKQASITAQNNVKISPWQNCIEVFNASLKDYAQINHEVYDLIICNPPFFQNSLLSENHQEKLAKHNVSLSYESLIFLSSALLKEEGQLSLIIPYDYKKHLISLCSINNLHPATITDVISKSGKSPNRTLCSFFKSVTKLPEFRHDVLTIRDDSGAYTNDYKTILSDYLLDF
ncbi:MAG: methyltransferase [Bacteroidales bacterium]|nr:methyltransferase [Bacteroidales bacterium]